MEMAVTMETAGQSKSKKKSKKIEDEMHSKLESLEKKVTEVIEKLHGYVTENCAKASIREKSSTLAFDLGTARSKEK